MSFVWDREVSFVPPFSSGLESGLGVCLLDKDERVSRLVDGWVYGWIGSVKRRAIIGLVVRWNELSMMMIDIDVDIYHSAGRRRWMGRVEYVL